MDTSFDIAQLETQFTELPPDLQHAEWLSFIDGLDHGDDGHHRFSLTLSGRWERGEHPGDFLSTHRVRPTKRATGRTETAQDLDALYGTPVF